MANWEPARKAAVLVDMFNGMVGISYVVSLAGLRAYQCRSSIKF
jgi:hypothetical protein